MPLVEHRLVNTTSCPGLVLSRDLCREVPDVGVFVEGASRDVLAEAGRLAAAMGHLADDRDVVVDPDAARVDLAARAPSNSSQRSAHCCRSARKTHRLASHRTDGRGDQGAGGVLRRPLTASAPLRVKVAKGRDTQVTWQDDFVTNSSCQSAADDGTGQDSGTAQDWAPDENG